MAKWSQLPKELLELIAQRLKTTFDILRFRSVCSSWRSSVPPKPRCLPYRFPSPPDDVIPDMAGDIFISKRTIFHLGFPENPEKIPQHHRLPIPTAG
ncbi:hypothetical protein L1049_015433 [Liquidambar formosana]|uniref:F-box domain-containing protein n=1 Tax=Liquidambar formosana TaxID=63359 RepID=A0AAP0RXK0_LIQFO